jgi:hypothetical protein
MKAFDVVTGQCLFFEREVGMLGLIWVAGLPVPEPSNLEAW